MPRGAETMDKMEDFIYTPVRMLHAAKLAVAVYRTMAAVYFCDT